MTKARSVITLPPKPNTAEPDCPTTQLRVAAYCRVSTENSEQKRSFLQQQRSFEVLIKTNPDYAFAGIYADDGKSGTTRKGRSEFNRLMADCKAGKIDRIVTKSVSRFGRNVVDCLECVRDLKCLGVDVYFEKENIHTLDAHGELFLTIMSALAESESWNLSDNVKWGIQRKYEQGHVKSIPSGKFLGYGKDEAGDLMIIEKEAAIVRRIYQEFLDGLGAIQIADCLTAEQVPMTFGGKHWCDSHIRKVLKNEKYKGDTLCLKTYNADPLTKRRVKNKGERDQHYFENTHSAIIEKAMWDCVQLEISRQARYAKAHQINVYQHHSEDLPLCGKVVCGTCGRIFAIRPRSDYPTAHWQCIGMKEIGDPKSCTNRKRIEKCGPEQALLTVWNSLVRDDIKISPLPDDDVLTRYRKCKLKALLAEYGELTTMQYNLINKILDHILVAEDHFRVTLLSGVTATVPLPQEAPKGPHWAFAYNPQSKLARLRIAKGLTQTALAEMVGVNQQFLHAFETGRGKMKLEVALKISEVLGVDWRDWLDILPETKKVKPPTRLKEIRLERGFSQTQTAKLIGTDRKYYCRIEAGMIRPSQSMTQRISRALGVVSEDWLGA